ncbi:MAG: peptidoglycan editing factor PgeF [Firmicutes bacterium]|nr:peptidoglycan editing factor PgeF [Bacillota bacterium]
MQEKIRLTEREKIPFFSLPLWEKMNICGHGFSSRLGGTGVGKNFSFDLGFKGGEDPLKVVENRERFLAIWGKKTTDLFCGEQVHGTGVAIIGSEEISASKRVFPATDALITAEREAVLGAFSADCLLVFFLEPSIPVVGIAHAGWRGTCKGIVARVVHLMKEKFAADCQKIQVSMGPSIGPCCYEVGDEVIESCHLSPWKKEMVLNPGGTAGRYYFDLKASNGNILLKEGIKPKHIFTNDFCTKCDDNLFYSYRRAGGTATGSHMGIIFLRNCGVR